MALEHGPPPARCTGPRRSWDLSGLADLSSVRRGLPEVVGALGVPRASGWPHDVVERLELVVTELGANALRHAATPVSVEVARSDGAWVVQVSDGAPRAHPYLPGPRPPGGGGHGLELVRRLSTAVGWQADGHVKHVWAVVADEVGPGL